MSDPKLRLSQPTAIDFCPHYTTEIVRVGLHEYRRCTICSGWKESSSQTWGPPPVEVTQPPDVPQYRDASARERAIIRELETCKVDLDRISRRIDDAIRKVQGYGSRPAASRDAAAEGGGNA